MAESSEGARAIKDKIYDKTGEQRISDASPNLELMVKDEAASEFLDKTMAELKNSGPLEALKLILNSKVAISNIDKQHAGVIEALGDSMIDFIKIDLPEDNVSFRTSASFLGIKARWRMYVEDATEGRLIKQLLEPTQQYSFEEKKPKGRGILGGLRK